MTKKLIGFLQFLKENEDKEFTLTVEDVLQKVEGWLPKWERSSSGENLTYTRRNKNIKFFVSLPKRKYWMDFLFKKLNEYLAPYGCNVYVDEENTNYQSGIINAEYDDVLFVRFELALPSGQKSAGVGNEFFQLESLNKLIVKNARQYGCATDDNKAFLPILDSDSETHLVTHFKRIEGNHKADICGVDVDGNECIFISVKDDRFQHYSGLSPRSSEKITNNVSTKRFIEKVASVFRTVNDDGRTKPSFKGHLISSEPVPPEVANIALFGKEYGSDEKGIDNVDFLIYKSAQLQKTDKYFNGDIPNVPVFKISGTFVHSSGDIPMDETMKPHYAVRRSSDASGRNDFGVVGALFCIAPKNFATKTIEDVIKEYEQK